MAEETYRNPLFGRRVDRYIPPELRQGIGALLAGADMLNPVSAYREYLKDVREGDVVGGVTNAAGFVAPGVASAFASRLARPVMSAVAPYADDAARVLMEVLTPTGAPDIQAAGRNLARGMSRREFLAGLGAAAATPALPVDEMLEGLGRAGARGGARAIDELMGLIARRNALYLEEGKETADFVRSHGEYEDLLSDYLEEKFGSSIKDAEKAVSEKISTSDISREDLEGLSDRSLESLLSEITFDDSLVPDDLGKADLELADRIREVLASRRPEAEVGSMLPDVTSRMVSGGDDFGRGLGSSGETVSSIPTREGIRAYHGSPHTFERFDMSKIGTGEGAQAYGRGLYFAEAEDVARGYRERLSYENIKNKFLEELPADADFEEVDDLIEQNYFTPDQTQFLKELRNNDWLGFDYPSQAITAATRGSLDDYDPSPALKDAIDKLGRMYEVRIDADPEDFLDWDKPLSEQPQVARALGYAPPEEIAAMKDEVRAGLARIAPDGDLSRFFDNPTPEFERLRQLDSEARRLSDWTGMTGQDLGFRLFQDPVHSATNVKDAARSGIPGIRYLDAGSRGAGDGSRNYVVFDDRLISIVRMYGIGGAAALLGVTAADVEQALAENMSQGELEGLLSGPQSRPD